MPDGIGLESLRRALQNGGPNSLPRGSGEYIVNPLLGAWHAAAVAVEPPPEPPLSPTRGFEETSRIEVPPARGCDCVSCNEARASANQAERIEVCRECIGAVACRKCRETAVKF